MVKFSRRMENALKGLGFATLALALPMTIYGDPKTKSADIASLYNIGLGCLLIGSLSEKQKYKEQLDDMARNEKNPTKGYFRKDRNGSWHYEGPTEFEM